MLKQMINKSIVILLTLALTASFAGCGRQDKTQIENCVSVYLTAVSGFNLDAMNLCLEDGENKDYGIDTSTFESAYVQTDTYKKQVESMFKALSATILFTVDSSEQTSNTTAVVNVTVSSADVSETAVGEYMQRKVDEYAQEHPELASKTDLEQNDMNITVMANAYKEFVKLQPRVEHSFEIFVCKKDNQWKIAGASKNTQLVGFLKNTYGTM